MPAKTRSPRKPRVIGIQERIRAHAEASEQCERWANKSQELAAAGQANEAAAAHRQARRFMARMIELEPK